MEFTPRYHLAASPFIRARMINGKLVLPAHGLKKTLENLQERVASFGLRLRAKERKAQ